MRLLQRLQGDPAWWEASATSSPASLYLTRTKALALDSGQATELARAAGLQVRAGATRGLDVFIIVLDLAETAAGGAGQASQAGCVRGTPGPRTRCRRRFEGSAERFGRGDWPCYPRRWKGCSG